MHFYFYYDKKTILLFIIRTFHNFKVRLIELIKRVKIKHTRIDFRITANAHSS